MNLICLSGRVGKDVDMYTTNSGHNYATTTLAVRRDKDTTDWFRLKLWGKTADSFAGHIGKGDRVEVFGSMLSYKDKDGVNRWEVNVNSWSFGGGGRNQNESQGSRQSVSVDPYADLESSGVGMEIPF